MNMGYKYKSGDKQVKIDIENGTACHKNKMSLRSYFFRAELTSGMILAFYSDSPWGRCHDMEKGWVIIDPKRKCILEEVATRSMGEATGDYKDWIADIHKQYGKTKKVFRDESGKCLWKMEE